MKKRVLSFLLCLCLCVGLFPGAALASDEAELLPAEEPVILPELPAEEPAEEAAEEPAEEPAEEIAEEPVEEPAEEVLSVDGTEGAYTVTMNVVYPEGYEGEKTGGLRVYEQTVAPGPEACSKDFSAYTDYTSMSMPIERAEGDTFWYSILSIDGMTGSVSWDLPSESGGSHEVNGVLYYGILGAVDTAYTVTLTYTEGEGASGEMGGSSDEPVVTTAYTITLDLTYPDGYTADDGGIQLGTEKLLGDGAVSPEYTMQYTIEPVCPEGLKVDSMEIICTAEHEEGTDCTHVSRYTDDGGNVWYNVSGSVTISIVYTVLDYENDFSVSLNELSDGDVGQFSALLTAEYVMPEPIDSYMYDIRIFLGTSEDSITNYYNSYSRDFRLKKNSDGTAYVYPEEFNELLPETTYYARAELTVQGSGQAYTHYSDILTFTTDGTKNDIPSVTVAPAEGEYTGEFIPCTVNGETAPITFSATDGRNGSDGVPYVSMVKLSVEEDGVYYFDLTFTDQTAPDLWLLLCRLYKMDENGYLQELDFTVNDCIARRYIGVGPEGPVSSGDTDVFDAYVTLTAGTYYLALDTDVDLLDAEVSVRLTNTGFRPTFSVSENGWDFTTDDGKPQCLRALVDYSVSAYYENGYEIQVLYDLASQYEDTGVMRYHAGAGLATDGTQPVSDSAAVRLGCFIEGLEYVYVARLVDHTTKEVLAESDVCQFELTVPAADFIRTFELGANSGVPSIITSDGKRTGRYGFGMSGELTHRFTTSNAGWYLFNTNCKTAVLEIMDKDGKVIAVTETGKTQTGEEAYWVSAKVYLEANSDYYVYTRGVNSVYPSVTISYLQGNVDMQTESLGVAEGMDQIAVDSLGNTINDLTKDEEGNPVELPAYVETDEAGEAALREAIETGDSLTAEITGKELGEAEVDAAVATAMESAALVVADTETAEVLLYLDLSVLLKLEDSEIAKLTETGEEITFCIPITEELSQLIANKALYVIRYHNGEAESIALEVSEQDGYIYFSSDLFSTFALYAVETELRNGFYWENDAWYYYVDGELNYAGLIECDGPEGGDPGLYYVNSKGKLITDCQYWISKNNGLVAKNKLFNFDGNGTMSEIQVVPKNGFCWENDAWYYYVDGKLNYAGLIECDGPEDGDPGLYYVNSKGKLITDCQYWISKNNGLVAKNKLFNFDGNGTMSEIQVVPKNGFYWENDAWYYYVDGKLNYAGLIECDGPEGGDPGLYYVNSKCKLITDCRYWISKNNGYMKNGMYTFDDNGTIVLS